MDRYQLQQLRQLPIEAVAQRLGLEVCRHKSLCPFHDDHHASLSFDMRRNTFRCFVCDAHGGTIDLVMRHLQLDFVAACRWLADENCIIISHYRPTVVNEPPRPFDTDRYARLFDRPFLNQAARRFLFRERMLSPQVIDRCRITSWRDRQGISWLQTPFFDIEGRLIGLQSRNLDYVKGEPSKFLFPKGACCSLYNQPVLNTLHEGDSLYIAEGCSDCWAMLSWGLKAIAIPSATLLKHRDKLLLQRLAREKSLRLHAVPDNDTPGHRLFMQLKEILPHIVCHTLPPGCKDFSEWYIRQRASLSHQDNTSS